MKRQGGKLGRHGAANAAWAWGMALAATVLAVLLRGLLDPFLGDRYPVATLFGGVAFAAWLGGVWPAVVSAVLGLLAAEYFFVLPRGNFTAVGWEEVVGSVAYLLSCGIVIGFVQALRVVHRRAAERSELLRVTLGSIGDAVITTDIEGRVTSLNAVAEELTGWKEREAAGRPLDEVFRILNEETRQPVEDPARRALREGAIVGLANHTVLLRKGAGEIPIDDSAAPIRDEEGQVVGCVLVFRDVTARRRAEEEVQSREARFRALVTASAQITWTADSQGRMHASPSWSAFTGQSHEQARDFGWIEALHPDDRERTRKVWLRAVERPGLFSMEHRVRAADGEHRWMAVRAVPVLDAAGGVREWVGMDSDITDRRRADEAQALLAAIVTASDDAIVSKTLDGEILSWNAGAQRLYGYSAAEAVGRHIDLIVPPELREQERTILERLRRGERVDHFETVRVAKDGRRLDVSLTISPLRDSAGRIVGASKVARDITERKRAEEALRESEQRFRVMADAAPVLIWMAGPDKLCTWFNKPWLDFTGRPIEAELGNGWADRVHPDDLERCLETYVFAFDAREPFTMEYRVQRHDGEYRWLLDHGLPRFEGEQFAGYIGSCVDITERKQAERELERLAARLQLVTDAMPALISYVDAEGCYRFMNRSYGEWFGTEQGALTGRHMSEVLGEAAYQRLRPHVEAALAGRRVRFEEDVPYDHGGSRSIHAEYVPDVRPDGVVAGFYALVTDITRRRRTEQALSESEERFRALADNIPQLAWMARPDGDVTWLNRRWFEYTGMGHEQARGWGWSAAVAPEHAQRVVEGYRRAVERGEPWSETFPLRGADGGYRWFLSRAFPIRDEEGAITLWFGTDTDITELLTAQEALREADRRKDEFLATLAHELRNPLAPIHNSLELLRRVAGDPARTAAAHDVIERQVAHMVRLVDDLLDVSRITRDRLELRRSRVELASVVHSSVDAVRALAEGERQRIEVDLPEPPVYLHADPVRLAQVFTNLLNNACKYTPQGGLVRISARLDEGGQVVVSVQDTGIGIPRDKLQSIFDMFAQVDRTLERARGGLGIGLTLSKRLVEMHGGSIEARSEGLGRGSEFVVRLPAATAPEGEARPEAPAGDGRATRRRVLVVDDNHDSAESLSLLLELSGHETRAAHDGMAAVEEAERFRPDIVLLDIGLPRMNGYDACRRIREQPWAKDVLIVALTGWGQEEDRRRSQEAGFDHHLVKPVDQASLTALLAAPRAEQDGPAERASADGSPADLGRAVEDPAGSGTPADDAADEQQEVDRQEPDRVE